MNAMAVARALVVSLAFAWSGVLGAEVSVPALTGHIIDQTATLSVAQIASLEQTLQAFEARKGSQLAVLIIGSTAPEAIEQYSLRVADQWKLGRKKIDDGVILLVAKNDRVVRIEVGYGLEGALTDVASKRIIGEVIAPYFKQGDYYDGIRTGVDQIIHVVDGEPLPAATERTDAHLLTVGGYLPAIFILALVIGGVLRQIFGKIPSALLTSGVIGVLAWFFAGALSLALGAGFFALVFAFLSSGIGVAGGFGMGGLGGGRGGGGFSGGGGFGGGGASGRW